MNKRLSNAEAATYWQNRAREAYTRLDEVRSIGNTGMIAFWMHEQAFCSACAMTCLIDLIRHGEALL